jgi:hypothetical protein
MFRRNFGEREIEEWESLTEIVDGVILVPEKDKSCLDL